MEQKRCAQIKKRRKKEKDKEDRKGGQKICGAKKNYF